MEVSLERLTRRYYVDFILKREKESCKKESVESVLVTLVALQFAAIVGIIPLRLTSE